MNSVYSSSDSCQNCIQTKRVSTRATNYCSYLDLATQPIDNAVIEAKKGQISKKTF